MKYRGFEITQQEDGAWIACRHDDLTDTWEWSKDELLASIDEFLEEEAELNGQFGVGA